MHSYLLQESCGRACCTLIICEFKRRLPPETYERHFKWLTSSGLHVIAHIFVEPIMVIADEERGTISLMIWRKCKNRFRPVLVVCCEIQIFKGSYDLLLLKQA